MSTLFCSYLQNFFLNIFVFFTKFVPLIQSKLQPTKAFVLLSASNLETENMFYYLFFLFLRHATVLKTEIMSTLHLFCMYSSLDLIICVCVQTLRKYITCLLKNSKTSINFWFSFFITIFSLSFINHRISLNPFQRGCVKETETSFIRQ